MGMNVIQVNNVTGTPPYSIFICDLTITTCFLLSEILTTIPPIIEDPIPQELEGLNPLILKIVDGSGCETFQVVDCTLSQTPTPTFSNIRRYQFTNCCDPTRQLVLEITNFTYFMQQQIEAGNAVDNDIPPVFVFNELPGCWTPSPLQTTSRPYAYVTVQDIYTSPTAPYINTCQECINIEQPEDCCCAPTLTNVTALWPGDIPDGPYEGQFANKYEIEFTSCGGGCCAISAEYYNEFADLWLPVLWFDNTDTCDSPLVVYVFPAQWALTNPQLVRLINNCCAYTSTGDCLECEQVTSTPSTPYEYTPSYIARFTRCDCDSGNSTTGSEYPLVIYVDGIDYPNPYSPNAPVIRYQGICYRFLAYDLAQNPDYTLITEPYDVYVAANTTCTPIQTTFEEQCCQNCLVYYNSGNNLYDARLNEYVTSNISVGSFFAHAVTQSKIYYSLGSTSPTFKSYNFLTPNTIDVNTEQTYTLPTSFFNATNRVITCIFANEFDGILIGATAVLQGQPSHQVLAFNPTTGALSVKFSRIGSNRAILQFANVYVPSVTATDNGYLLLTKNNLNGQTFLEQYDGAGVFQNEVLVPILNFIGNPLSAIGFYSNLGIVNEYNSLALVFSNGLVAIPSYDPSTNLITLSPQFLMANVNSGTKFAQRKGCLRASILTQILSVSSTPTRTPTRTPAPTPTNTRTPSGCDPCVDYIEVVLDTIGFECNGGVEFTTLAQRLRVTLDDCGLSSGNVVSHSPWESLTGSWNLNNEAEGLENCCSYDFNRPPGYPVGPNVPLCGSFQTRERYVKGNFTVPTSIACATWPNPPGPLPKRKLSFSNYWNYAGGETDCRYGVGNLGLFGFKVTMTGYKYDTFGPAVIAWGPFWTCASHKTSFFISICTGEISNREDT